MTEPKTILDPNKVNETLLFIHDLFDRSQVPLLALKDTAKQIRETQDGLSPNLQLTAIELGVLRKDLTQSGTPMLEGLFKMYNVNPEWTEGLIKFERNGVPVFIKIVNRKYAFFQNLQKAYYRTCEFVIPNPFDNYYKARFIIKWRK